MRFGFFGSRGINEFLNEAGEGIYFTLTRGCKSYERVFPNVGQPISPAPRHYLHVDSPEVFSDVSLGPCCFRPFYAEYEIDGDAFIWLQYQKNIYLKASVSEPIVFHPVGMVRPSQRGLAIGEHFFIEGVALEQPITGDFECVVSPVPFTEPSFSITALEMRNIRAFCPETSAIAPVFYNLRASPILKNRLCVEVNKTWAEFIAAVFARPELTEGPLLFAWDSAFASIILAEFDIDLAKRTLLSLLETVGPDGRLPQIRLGTATSNRTSPPVWFLAAEKIIQNSGDMRFLRRIYPILRANYRWFKSNRMNDNATFSWGTDNEEDGALLRINGRIGAIIESGLDDSPLFDDVGFENGKLNIACIDLSSLVYRSCEIMLSFARMSADDQMEHKDDVAEFETDLSLYREAVKTFFFHRQGVANSYWRAAGERYPCNELTPLSFYPLLTSLLDGRSVRLLRDLFYSPHFSGTTILPSVSFLSQRYDGDGDYWRGRIWPPLVYLAAEGFRRYDAEVYSQIKDRAHHLLENEWQRHGHVHENYSSRTGWGEPSPGVYARSCPLYSWGGLLGII